MSMGIHITKCQCARCLSLLDYLNRFSYWAPLLYDEKQIPFWAGSGSTFEIEEIMKMGCILFWSSQTTLSSPTPLPLPLHCIFRIFFFFFLHWSYGERSYGELWEAGLEEMWLTPPEARSSHSNQSHHFTLPAFVHLPTFHTEVAIWPGDGGYSASLQEIHHMS